MKRIAFTIMCATALMSANAASYADYDYANVANEVANRWQFTILKAYDWNGSEWSLGNANEFFYAPDGLVSVREITYKDGRVMRENNTYNDNGRLVEQITEMAETADGEFENSTRLTRRYDERVPSFITVETEEIWKDGAWQPAKGYRNEVTRNEDGNVTMVEHSELSEGQLEYRYTYRMIITYDDNGTATGITECSLTYDTTTGNYTVIPGNSYTEVTWATTDGQILSIDNLFKGANKIESALLFIPEETEGSLTVTYGNNGSYEITTVQHDEFDECTEIRTVTPLDDNGNIEILTERVDRSHGDRICTSWTTDILKLDQFGLIQKHYVEEKLSFKGGIVGSSILKDTRGQIDYDKATGYPLTWVVREYDTEEECHVKVFKADFAGFPDAPNAIDAIETDEDETTWYDLQGIRIEKPTTPGLYIRRHAGHSQKIVIK